MFRLALYLTPRHGVKVIDKHCRRSVLSLSSKLFHSYRYLINRNGHFGIFSAISLIASIAKTGKMEAQNGKILILY